MSGDHDKYLFEHDGYKDAPFKLNSELVPVNRHDLEAKIQAVWNTKDDLDAIRRNIEYMDEDQIHGAVDGLAIFVDMRCDDLLKTFEAYIHNDKLARRVLSEEIHEGFNELMKGADL
jgi:hypothetical protein